MTHIISYMHIYICHISFPNFQSFWHLTPSYKIDVYIYIYTCILNVYMFQCKRLSLTYPQKEAKLKMDCAKKISSNLSQLFLVQENLAFLFSRFLVFGGCKTKKKHVDHYISLVFCFHEYMVFPLLFVSGCSLTPVLVGFFLGEEIPQKTNNNGRSQEYPKASPGRPGQRTLPNKPRPKPGQRWEIVCWYLCKYIYIYLYVCLCVSKDLYDICLYLSIFLYIHIYSTAY